MFKSNQILGVNGGQIQYARTNTAGTDTGAQFFRANDLAASSQRRLPGQKIEAGLGGLGGGSSTPLSVKVAWPTEYLYYLTGILAGADPMVTDPSSLALHYRDMYLLDHTVGSAVDIQSSFPFSEFNLRGLDEKDLKPFQEAVARLDLQRLMPEISTAYLVDGYFCGSLVFDPRSRQFIDVMLHDALNCTVKFSPFHNVDAEIHVKVNMAMADLLTSNSRYYKRYLDNLPPAFLQLLEEGEFTLDPINTLFVARKTLTDRSYVSYIHRCLPMYLIEKTMYRGTLTEAHRRQRAMTHITAGDKDWVPTTEELHQIVNQFQTAEYDPLGGWISTRSSVQTTDLRPGGDFWTWMEVCEQMTPYKLRALGMNESFLTGNASFASAEQAYSSFLESQAAYREKLTDDVFYRKIFPLIAVVNHLYKDPNGMRANESVVDFLFNANARSNLKIPQVHWVKKLTTNREEGMMDMLDQLDQRNVPIPIKMWAAAAGIDLESLIRDLSEDTELRKRLAEATGHSRAMSYETQDRGGWNDQGTQPNKQAIHPFRYPSQYDEDYEAAVRQRMGLPIQSFAQGGSHRRNLLTRSWTEEQGLLSEPNKSGSGRKHIIDQVGARKRSNDQILKAARAMEDPNHREQVRQRNIRVNGTDKIAGAEAIPTKRPKFF
jgi:hypothetical protein